MGTPSACQYQPKMLQILAHYTYGIILPKGHGSAKEPLLLGGPEGVEIINWECCEVLALFDKNEVTSTGCTTRQSPFWEASVTHTCWTIHQLPWSCPGRSRQQADDW